MVQEDRIVTAITKKRPAQLPDPRRRFHPARRLRIEVAQLLQLPVFRLRQYPDAHGFRHIDGAVLGLILLPRLERLGIVADAAAALRAFRGAIEEYEFARCLIAA